MNKIWRNILVLLFLLYFWIKTNIFVPFYQRRNQMLYKIFQHQIFVLVILTQSLPYKIWFLSYFWFLNVDIMFNFLEKWVVSIINSVKFSFIIFNSRVNFYFCPEFQQLLKDKMPTFSYHPFFLNFYTIYSKTTTA